MKNLKLTRAFYVQPTLRAAKDFLGKYLVRKIGRQILAGKIIETEAYIGPQDRASHAFGGKITPRNRAEYLIGGHVYIYLVYGMYWQLNITTAKAGQPQCVLIRALEPVESSQKFKNQKSKGKTTIKNSKITNGPGKLCVWLKLEKSFYGENLTKSKRLWLEDSAPRRVRGRWHWSRVPESKIVKTPRIGIDYAGPDWASKKWRFLLGD